MPQRLLNKVAVITGAGSGIGRAIAERFLTEGAKVVVFGRNRPPLEQLAQQAPARTLVIAGDVTRIEDLRQLVGQTGRRFGNVDILVPNAGIARAIPFSECTAESVNEQFQVNFFGALETVREFLNDLNPGASVLFITSVPAKENHPGLAVYNASKAALKSLAQSLAVELAPQKIRVNCIAPGPTETPFWQKLGQSADRLQEMTAQINERLIPGRFGQPEQVAEAAVFLASDAAANIFGQEIVVDGGYSLG